MWLNLIVCLLVLVHKSFCQEPKTSPKTIFAETTTEKEIDHMDIAEEEQEAALNLDYGIYTTVKFRYINSQYDNLKKIEKCQDDYIKCLTTQGVAIPVCSYNWMEDYPRSDGFFLADSYCDVYFDNCRRQIRFWRIIDYGTCKYLMLEDKERKLIIPHTLRKFYKMSSSFLSKIANLVRGNKSSNDNQ
ncbi:uncharacterized protein LOC119838009 [Zerene cesonia]|uniref:uncharacterized protein LOC119838009 n=1 Tax=Zerene cesonia TaxID=33412 RepID=UPI0018E51483|nr:uncharacterized protein LOC119838009 [Zerene cesonia]